MKEINGRIMDLYIVIVLLLSGKTEANSKLVLQGVSDGELNDEGFEQAKASTC